jgi:hypothetical protein
MKNYPCLPFLCEIMEVERFLGAENDTVRQLRELIEGRNKSGIGDLSGFLKSSLFKL